MNLLLDTCVDLDLEPAMLGHVFFVPDISNQKNMALYRDKNSTVCNV